MRNSQDEGKGSPTMIDVHRPTERKEDKLMTKVTNSRKNKVK